MNTNIVPVEVLTTSSIENNKVIATINQEALEATKQGIINFVENVKITEDNFQEVMDSIKKITSFEKMIKAGSTRFMDSFKEISIVDSYLKDSLSTIETYKKRLSDTLKPIKNKIIENGLRKELESRIELNLSFVKLKNKGIKSLEIPKKLFYEKYYRIKEPRGVTADGSVGINEILEAEVKLIEDEEARLKLIKIETVGKKEAIKIMDEQIAKLQVTKSDEEFSFDTNMPNMLSGLPTIPKHTQKDDWSGNFHQKEPQPQIDFNNIEKNDLSIFDEDLHSVEAKILINRCVDTSKIGLNLVKGLGKIAKKELKISTLKIELVVPLEISKIKGMGFELLRENFSKLIKIYYNGIVKVEISFIGELKDINNIQY